MEMKYGEKEIREFDINKEENFIKTTKELIKIIKVKYQFYKEMMISFSKKNTLEEMSVYKNELKVFFKDKKRMEIFKLLKIKTIDIGNDNENNLKALKGLESFYNNYLVLKKKYDK